MAEHGERSGLDLAAWHRALVERVHDPVRLAAVERTGLLDTGADESFDRLTRLAARTLGVPWAFVTLVDDHRSFWKSCFGVDADDPADRQNAVGDSFCQYVVALGEMLLIDDARLDRRTMDNPSIESMGVIAWAGCPLWSADGHVLGTFCAVSPTARRWSADDVEVLTALAGAAASELQLRVALGHAESAASQLEQQLVSHRQLSARGEHLADLARNLAAAYSTAQVSRAVAAIAPQVLAARFVNIHLLDESRTSLHVTASGGVPAEVASRYRRLPVDMTTPAGSAVLGRRAVFASSLAEYAQQWPALAADAAAVGLAAATAWPIVRSDGTLIGALSVAWGIELEFSPLLEGALATVAQMCAAALERGQIGDDHERLIGALQLALLPAMPELDGLDVAARYVPANHRLGFGGDWYDVFAVTDSLIAVVVGDVCGHGIPAAATMALLRGTFNALVHLKVEALHELFDDAERWFVPDEVFVATVAVHVIDLEREEVRYVSAGHPPSLIAYPDGSTASLLGGRRPVFGIGGAAPAVATVAFPPGSVLVGFTDGLFERRNVAWDDGYDELAARLAELRGAPAAEIASTLESSIDWTPEDDVAFVVAVHTGPPAPPGS